MHAASIATLVLVVLTIAVLAFYLITVAVLLNRVSAKLAAVITSVRAIPGKTQPVPGILNGMRSDLSEAQGGLEALLRRKS